MERTKLPVSNHLFLVKNNEILLYRRKWGVQEGKYNVIAGHLDGGETATEAIIREAQEEAGIIIKPENLKFACVSHSFAGDKEYVQFFMYCEEREWQIQNLEPERCYEMKFFPINDLPENTTPYIKKAIECFLDKIYYYEYK